MDPTNLFRLMETGCIVCRPDGLSVRIHPSWIVEGEDRLSYASLIRLIEGCREYHWNIDILPKANDTTVDSILKSITGNFSNPISAMRLITITYSVTDVRSKSYTLRFTVRDGEDQTLYAEFDLVSVFYDPITCKSEAPPKAVLNHISRLHTQRRNEDEQ